MDDAYYRDRLSAYADNQLPLDERQAVDEHLKQNAESRRMLEEIMRFKQFADEHGGLDETDYFEQNARAIEQRLGLVADTPITDIGKPRFSGLGWKIAAAAASIAVLTFIGLNSDDIRHMLSSPGDQARLSETPQPAQATDQARHFREQVADHQDTSATTATQNDYKIEAELHSAPIDEGSRDADAGETAMVPPASEPRSTAEKELALQDAEEVRASRIAVDSDRKRPAAAAPKLERVPENKESLPDLRAAKEKERTLTTEESSNKPLDQLRQAAKTLSGTSDWKALPGVQSLAESSKPAADIGTVESKQSMDVWRARRDSLLPLYLAMTGDTTVAGRHVTEAVTKGRLDIGEFSLPDIERELVDCWYHIARYSSSAHEQRDARTSLERYSERRAAHYSDVARQKLSQLDSLGQEPDR